MTTDTTDLEQIVDAWTPFLFAFLLVGLVIKVGITLWDRLWKRRCEAASARAADLAERPARIEELERECEIGGWGTADETSTHGRRGPTEDTP